VSRGGVRVGSGRPATVTLRQRLLIGKACEKEWQLELTFSNGKRPYGKRQSILAWQTGRVGDFFGKEVSCRFVESCWTKYRKFSKTGQDLPID